MAAPDQTAVDQHVAAFKAELAGATNAREAQAVRDKYLGRKNSVVASWMQTIASAAPEQKKEIGRFANLLKEAIESHWTTFLESGQIAERPVNAVDVTLPGRTPRLGHRHPLTIVRERMEAIFTRMGFAPVEGPEAEDEWHCFDALNMPAEHPARDMQDTLYLGFPLKGHSGRSDDLRTLLRTHTSAVQIRYMETHQPPIRIVVPGRVYRRDDLDLTHSPAFGQLEALVVGEGISMAHLKGTLLAFVREMFSPSSRVRFRPSFFPYTEPSAEIDISCWQCDGAGCPMCKRTGWIELGGCGMVHPAVFEAVGYDAERFTGFAWGLGIERIAILRHQVTDIRLFYENDLRFLEQFPYLIMRLLISWVRDFVDVRASPQEIADTLGVRGFEVASVEPLPADDGVIDFEVTANRPDCLSVLGFAREIATCFNLPLRLPSHESGAAAALAPVKTGESDRVSVTIEDPELCPRYVAAVAEVTAGMTPAWMQARLVAAGVRPVSPLVDITNYVLMELGHPMHAFDLAKIAGPELRIRRARPGEAITTLDGIARPLDDQMLVIADARQPQAIAGVMGGAVSEVSSGTRTVAFESAYFKPASIRRTSKRLGLKTEASARFERGADINMPLTATERAIALMHQIGAGHAIGAVADRYPLPRGPKSLTLRRARLTELLGLAVPDAEVERILRALGLGVEPTPEGWRVEAPTFRVDLLREVDLIEEVGRHYGFDRLESVFPVITAAAPPPDPRIGRDRLVRKVLTAAGLSEAITFGFIEAKAANAFLVREDGGLVPVANPLSGKFDTMRASLLPGLVDAVAHNRRHGRRDVALFELGARFSRRDGETEGVGIAWTGTAQDHWSAPTRDVDFFDVKGLVDDLASVIGFEPAMTPATEAFLVAGQAAAVMVNQERVGLIGLVAPAAAEGRGAPRHDKIFVAELDLDRIWDLLPDDVRRREETASIEPLPRFPHVVRDLSIVVSDSLPAENIRGTIQRAAALGPAPLVTLGFFDRYKGKDLQDGTVSLSVRLTFQASDRTLTDAEVQNSVDAILAALTREHRAVQR